MPFLSVRVSTKVGTPTNSWQEGGLGSLEMEGGVEFFKN